MQLMCIRTLTQFCSQELSLQQACQRAVHARIQFAHLHGRRSHCVCAASRRDRHWSRYHASRITHPTHWPHVKHPTPWFRSPRRHHKFSAVQGALLSSCCLRASHTSLSGCSWAAVSTRLSHKARRPLCIVSLPPRKSNAVTCALVPPIYNFICVANDNCMQLCSSRTRLPVEWILWASTLPMQNGCGKKASA